MWALIYIDGCLMQLDALFDYLKLKLILSTLDDINKFLLINHSCRKELFERKRRNFSSNLIVEKKEFLHHA